jgi:hypothetical protein
MQVFLLSTLLSSLLLHGAAVKSYRKETEKGGGAGSYFKVIFYGLIGFLLGSVALFALCVLMGAPLVVLTERTLALAMVLSLFTVVPIFALSCRSGDGVTETAYKLLTTGLYHGDDLEVKSLCFIFSRRSSLVLEREISGRDTHPILLLLLSNTAMSSLLTCTSCPSPPLPPPTLS